MEIKQLEGKILTSIEVVKDEEHEILFTCSDGVKYKMYHYQDCCESVTIEDICGDLDDLLQTGILLAEECTNEGDTDWGTETWTFYTI